jgi:hypothetical protein
MEQLKTLIIMMTFLTTIAHGQVKRAAYKQSSDTIEFSGSKVFSKLILYQDRTFTYEYRTTLSCFLWFDSRGTWQMNDHYLTLTDSVRSNHPEIDMLNQIVERTTTYFVNGDDLIFTKQRTSNDRFIPSRPLRGNFKLANE